MMWNNPKATNAAGTIAVGAYGAAIGLVVYNIMSSRMFADFALGKHISFALALGFPLALVFSTRMFQQFAENILALRSLPVEEGEAREIEAGVNWAGASLSALLVATLVWFSVSMLRLQVQVVRDVSEVDYLLRPEVKASQDALDRAQNAYNLVLADTKSLDVALAQVQSTEAALKSIGSARRNISSEDPNTQYLIASSMSVDSRSRSKAVQAHDKASEHLKATQKSRDQRVLAAKNELQKATEQHQQVIAEAKVKYGGRSLIELAEQEAGVSGISMVAYLPESASIVITLLLGFSMIMERGKLAPRRILVRRSLSVPPAERPVPALTREQRLVITALQRGAQSLGQIEKATTEMGLRIPRSSARLMLIDMKASKHPQITAIKHLLPGGTNGTV